MRYYTYLLITTLLITAAGCSKTQDIQVPAEDLQENDAADDRRPEKTESVINNAVEEKADDNEGIGDDNGAADLPNGDRLDGDGELACSDENGCECGSQLCPKGYVCDVYLCVEKYVGDDGNRIERFYCDDPLGCRCAPNGVDCPNGAVCVQYHRNPDYGSEERYICEKIDKKFKDKNELFEFLKKLIHEPFIPDKSDNLIFDCSYKGSEGYFINAQDGRTYKNLKVACSDPGCDCAGTPLAKDYLCTKHTLILDRADPAKDPWEYSEYVCPKYYSGGYDESCVMEDEVTFAGLGDSKLIVQKMSGVGAEVV